MIDGHGHRGAVMPTRIPRKEEILKALDIIGGDGHTIFKREAFEGTLPASFIDKYVKEHKSGSHPKERIFASGGEVPSLVGVYGLSLLYGLRRIVGADFPEEGPFGMRGRGSQAMELTENIRRKLDG
jgi:hypothetical protein